ncbi:hypothetical protein GP486_006945 [Trichoglossum hirsutum]|uniref:Uncharacterized protein n=1 Tax=Trichoglossum hirsutum TaxID=265104 RepID=A0A9P8IGH3_9PEZI|nr:hypothetical protein GP486_006945 [Trichoglossum hirsutum]
MDGEGWMDWPKEPRGVKRPPEDDLDSERRLVKRLNLLDLGRNLSLYTPADAEQPSSSAGNGKIASAANDVMQLDDTKHKVYIYNLEDELAESDTQEDALIFLPDIEKRMTRIPKSILRNPQQTTPPLPPLPPTNTEVVLYNVPSSLSVPKEHDSVRKAIIEARARARERQAQEMQNGLTTPSPPISGATGGSNDSSKTLGAAAGNTMANRLGATPLGGVAPSSIGSPLPPRVNNTIGVNIFAPPVQNPTAGGFASMHPNTSPHIPSSTASVTDSIFSPPPLPPPNRIPLMDEYAASPFANGFSAKPVDVHQKIVVIEDPDVMDIE